MHRAFAWVPAILWMWAAPVFADSAPEWRPDGAADGLGIERREVRGSSYDELRITAVRSLDLARLCDVIFAPGREISSNVHFRKREVLRETDTERWTYEQIAVAWVSDRDYVMHTKLEAPASSGRCEVSFETQNDPSRPPVRGIVRIPCIRGRWTVVPLPDGRLWIGYRVFSDPGGGIPAFLARGGQRSAALALVEGVLAAAAAPSGTERAARATAAGRASGSRP